MQNFNFDDFSDKDKNNLINNASNAKKQNDFYEKIRQKVNEYIKEHPNAKHINYIMLFPDFFYLSCKLLGDNRVPIKNKLYLGAAITYCISPLDIIPDILPGGLTDDILIIIKTLSDLINSVDNNIICEHWLGNENIIKVIKELSEIISEALSNKTFSNKISEFMNSLRNK